MKKTLALAVMAAMLFLPVGVQAAVVGSFDFDDKSVTGYSENGLLADTPDYDWWYGCSPTSAGMLMGYYDIHGYNGLRYDNLVAGGLAEFSTYGLDPWDALAHHAIASQGHVADFYSGGYGASDDDLAGPFHQFNSLADFMGTSQDSAGNSNGSTTFWYYSDGSRLYAEEIYLSGSSYYDSSGMYGLWEYFQYSGYGDPDPYATDVNLFNQYTDNVGLTYGFTFADYMAEIDSGRVVMLHVEGHSMLGYGYNPDGTIVLYDTWNPGLHTMAWGGSYSGRELYGVTVFEPFGGTEAAVPVPAAVWLLASGLIGLAGLRRKFYR